MQTHDFPSFIGMVGLAGPFGTPKSEPVQVDYGHPALGVNGFGAAFRRSCRTGL